MIGQIHQPLDPGGLVCPKEFARADVYPSRDGIPHGDLILLIQRRNQLFLGADVAVDAAGGEVEEAGDGGLFGEGRYRALTYPECGPGS